MPHQLEMVCLEDLVPQSHNYRKFIKVFNFDKLKPTLRKTSISLHHRGFGTMRLFKCILLQHLEDLSFRELERFLKENTAAKWFCGFGLSEETPDHSTLCVFSQKFGLKTSEKIFLILKQQLQQEGLMNEFFTMVDATHLISKSQLWQERDKAIQAKYEKLNNSNISEFSHDKDARFGCKGGDKFWYGYKLHQSIDMQTGLINQVYLSAANVTDAKGLKHVLPSQGAVYADKGYCTSEALSDSISAGVHLRAIKKNNMKGKDFKLDAYLTKLRSPYEQMFSKIRRRVRYASLMRNQAAAYLDAVAFNLKRLAVLTG